ncbi:uncharacterized protein ycf23-like isoform X2 [Malania oleifera]|uniref:uncharacterized protein ycf23-like isoform X2 n=1 Tax=Malania oleifera TaxID=397392 RepID=UPI0025AEBB1F|nr:uncharacterized protein ycf23-like isoform X2 [Malania oleifera]
MQSSMRMAALPASPPLLKPNHSFLLGDFLTSKPVSPIRRRRRASLTTRALLQTTKDSALKEFHERRALKIISGLQNFNKDNVVSVVTAADKVCVSSVDPAAFPGAVEAGALMVEIGNYDSFYDMGMVFSPEQVLKLTKETRRVLPSVALSVTVPHTLSLPDQTKLAELLEQEGVDIIQTEGGKCSNPSKSGVLGLIEKATPTLAAAYAISQAVKIPVMCSSGLSAVTAPMAIAAGAAGVGVGSAVNKLNDVVAMIAEVRSIADSIGASADRHTKSKERTLRSL